MRRIGDFADKHWKPLMLLGVLVLIAGLAVLGYNQLTTGSFMARDIELTGGKQIEIVLQGTVDAGQVRQLVPEAGVQLITGASPTLLIEVPPESDEQAIVARLADAGITGSVSVRTIGPLLGELFFQQTQLAIAVGFVLIAIVIFILFRTFVPSVAVLLAATTDIVAALAVLSLLGFKLSLPILAGALMMIGYSVDTDIVLTAEVVKHKEGSFRDRVRKAARTGLTMTATAILAVAAMYVASGNVVIQNVASVLLVGFLIDIPVTWFTNVGLLRWWYLRKEKKEAGA
jgi:preprotein translocase subunit SecF